MSEILVISYLRNTPQSNIRQLAKARIAAACTLSVNIASITVNRTRLADISLIVGEIVARAIGLAKVFIKIKISITRSAKG